MSDIQTIAKRYFELQTKAEELKAYTKANNETWDEVEKELIEEMVNEGTSSIGIDGIGLFSLRTKTFLSVNSANHAKFYEYLRQSGHGSLIKDYVNPATLGAFLKEHLEELKGIAIASGKDDIEARDKSVEFLKEKGAAYFSEKTIALTKKG